MKFHNRFLSGMHAFVLLWATQGLSSLGSSMTSYTLVVWAYEQTGSALSTALLTICSYAPYVLCSIFAGALSDRWDKKRTMLVCDSLAAATTLLVLALLASGRLALWHLYLINALNGLANTVQQPASDVAVSLLAPPEQYQRVGGMRAFSTSLVTILAPVCATALFGLAGLPVVIAFDLISFGAAFAALALFIQIPSVRNNGSTCPVRQAVREGLLYLRQNQGILDLILFLSAINLTASMYEAALPAMLLSRPGGGRTVLGLVSACTGVANLIGSAVVTLRAAPKSRVRAICNSLLFSMSTENFLLTFGRSAPVWCIGAVLGWVSIPIMNTNLDALLRSHIPLEMQGRVYSVRNTLQFFTIPVGSLLGGVLVDRVFEPLLAAQAPGSPLVWLLGSGKGTGAALLFFILGLLGVGTCLFFRQDKHLWALEQAEPAGLPPSKK